jgi:hypothetical protein
MRRKLLTTAPVRAGDCAQTEPEFGRCKDVERLYGVRRGSLYGLHRQGKIKGVLLRVAGAKSGVRLWHLQSVRDFIEGEMARQNPEPATINAIKQPTPAAKAAMPEGVAQ